MYLCKMQVYIKQEDAFASYIRHLFKTKYTTIPTPYKCFNLKPMSENVK